MQKTFNGQLGKQSSSMIAHMISSKMPGGFNILPQAEITLPIATVSNPADRIAP